MALKRFRPDRSFDAFHAGEVIELDTDDETAQRYIRTGYLEEVADDEPAAEAAAEAVREPAGFAVPAAVVSTSATPATAEAEASSSGEEGGDGGTVQGDGEARPVARSRRRQ